MTAGKRYKLSFDVFCSSNEANANRGILAGSADGLGKINTYSPEKECVAAENIESGKWVTVKGEFTAKESGTLQLYAYGIKEFYIDNVNVAEPEVVYATYKIPAAIFKGIFFKRFCLKCILTVFVKKLKFNFCMC